MPRDEYFPFFLSDEGKCTLCGTQLFDDECSNCGASQISIADVWVKHMEALEQTGVICSNATSRKFGFRWMLAGLKISKLNTQLLEKLWALTKSEYQESLIEIEQKRKMSKHRTTITLRKLRRQSKPIIPLLLELAAMKRAHVPWYYEPNKLFLYPIILLTLFVAVLALIESV